MVWAFVLSFVCALIVGYAWGKSEQDSAVESLRRENESLARILKREAATAWYDDFKVGGSC